MNNQTKNLILYLCLHIIGIMYYMTLARIFWFFPIQILFNDFYDEFFLYPSLVFWISTLWLFIGSAKLVQLQYYYTQKSQDFSDNHMIKNFFKKLILIGFLPLMKTNYHKNIEI